MSQFFVVMTKFRDIVGFYGSADLNTNGGDKDNLMRGQTIDEIG